MHQAPSVRPLSYWIHQDQTTVQVLMVTNTKAIDPSLWAPTVIYCDEHGEHWSLPLSVWHQQMRMAPQQIPPQPVPSPPDQPPVVAKLWRTASFQIAFECNSALATHLARMESLTQTIQSDVEQLKMQMAEVSRP